MKKTWRWFGRNDSITLPMLRQIGVEGIVTALHSIPNGEVWPYEDIVEMKRYIESYGLEWSVVESLPVSEAIKYGGPERDVLIERVIILAARDVVAGGEQGDGFIVHSQDTFLSEYGHARRQTFSPAECAMLFFFSHFAKRK